MSLVERLKNKEEQALQQLMEQYGNILLRTAVLLMRDRQIAEEAVQDTYVVAFQNIDQLESDEKLKSWLMKITVNQCRTRMRRWSWKHIFLKKEADSWENVIDERDGEPESLLMTNYENQLLHQHIQSLPYKYREVITLYYFQELSIKEIAILLDGNENSVKTKLRRGRTLLKGSLEEGGEKDETV
ncbi:sigma-70 family RNA polymerase sigma factor [Bacillus shivajii]|uniref:sigma-70 family RNA polymerase sigma factor n=1 Tax=Bacillus shivajii TaxID=1983719 RepID=UPI001CFB8683|nr:sigma-70 family RNA polymerase sigma factor [Bacillus shivajii]UCZ54416.1 sigma-70 family RNA polymerase sigma factor [Bacillus shivajii]